MQWYIANCFLPITLHIVLVALRLIYASIWGKYMHSVVICAAKRSAVGNLRGMFAEIEAHDISTYVIKELLHSINLSPEYIDELVVGQVLSGLTGQNPPRKTALDVGMLEKSTAITINQVCGSGLRSIAIAYQQIITQNAEAIIAGGQENMTLAPHGARLRLGKKMGDIALNDSILTDGLIDIFSCHHMGITVENLAKKYNISRTEQDEFSLASHQKAAKATKEGLFKQEIVPIIIESKKGPIVLEKDEFIRADTSMEQLARLKPSFIKDGSVTAGNSSGMNDGAAFVLVASEKFANTHNLPIIAKIKSFAQIGVNPALMGIGPVPATKAALAKAKWDIKELDLIECNEAFAAQSIAVNKELKWDLSKLNPLGGAIALGHPIGASGARITVTLLNNMQRTNAKKGLATLCVGGGMGLAMCFERP